MKVFITGGTGFIGQHLSKLLIANGYQIVVATRDPGSYARPEKGNGNSNKKFGKSEYFDEEEKMHNNRKLVQFVKLQEDMSEDMQDCSIVINLAGESLIAKRWSATVKKRLYESRIDTTRWLVAGMRKMDRKPNVLISASGINYYGDYGNEIITEEMEPGTDFLAEICRDWEFEARKAEEIGIRVVNPRFAVALGTEGGALQTLLTVFKSFVGGSIGPGTQYFSWIHIDDLCRSILFAITNDKIEGPVNTSSPDPVPLKEFSAALGKSLSRPSFFHVPEMAARFAIGEAVSMVTASLRVIPEKLQKHDFKFEYPTVDQAITDLVND